MKNACKLAKRCYKKLEQGDFEDCASSKKYRAVGNLVANLELRK